MIARRIVLALTIAGVLAAAVTVLQAQSGENAPGVEQSAVQTVSGGRLLDIFDRVRETRAQRLEGTWVLSVSPVLPPGVTPPPPFRTYLTASRGGALIGSDRSRPSDNPQHGTWVHLGGDEFAWTLVQDRFDVMGNFLGTFKAQTRVTLTMKDEFIGVASVEFRDAAGNLTLARCATNRGERIAVGPLSPGCQSIEPPR